MLLFSQLVSQGRIIFPYESYNGIETIIALEEVPTSSKFELESEP